MTLISTQRVYTGRIVSLDVDTVRLPNGTVREFEMLRHPGAAAVLPFLDDPTSDNPRVLLIRQYRHATDGWLWEVPAGKRDGDEDPAVTARRELQEETGYQCSHLLPLTSIWTTPGFTDEVIHLYMASGLTSGPTAHEADEIMELHELRWNKVMAMLRSGEITDTKTVNTILWKAAIYDIR